MISTLSVRNPGYDNRAMFLGGSLDHAIRAVDMEDGMPTADRIEVDRPERPAFGPMPADPRHETYLRQRCVSGPWTWWAYVLVGYDPPVGHLLDAYPYART